MTDAHVTSMHHADFALVARTRLKPLKPTVAGVSETNHLESVWGVV